MNLSNLLPGARARYYLATADIVTLPAGQFVPVVFRQTEFDTAGFFDDNGNLVAKTPGFYRVKLGVEVAGPESILVRAGSAIHYSDAQAGFVNPRNGVSASVERTVFMSPNEQFLFGVQQNDSIDRDLFADPNANFIEIEYLGL